MLKLLATIYTLICLSCSSYIARLIGNKMLEIILIRKNKKLKFAKNFSNKNKYIIFYINHRLSKKYIFLIYIPRYSFYI